MSSQAKESKDPGPIFPIGPAGKRSLRRALIRSTDPAQTIETFQKENSLHSMMARAFGTTPQHEYRSTRKSSETKTVESLDTDSVMTFLSRIGVTHHEVHKRISDTIMKQLEDEIRKARSKEKLLDLLSSCWVYSTTITELRPILWAVLKQLGEQTPLPVLKALSEREEDGSLKHSEIFQPLPSALKRLCWEADWDDRVPLEPDSGPAEYLEIVKSTLLFQTIEPLILQYTESKTLTKAADQPFVSTLRERRYLTKQRRALSSSTTTSSSVTTVGVLRGTTSSTATDDGSLTSGKSVSQLRGLLCDTVGAASTFRPKLLYALLSILMAQHGSNRKHYVTGSNHLKCTLVADILLSAGGPLPKAYHYVLTLARLLDECVQEGNIDDLALSRIQSALRQIFQPDEDVATESPKKKRKLETSSIDNKDSSSSLKRQLNRIITAGLGAMKDADPQNLFLNPVTDAIAPGYSDVIKKPMSIVTMEQKVKEDAYNSVTDWEQDVTLMFKNCIDYNRGAGGQWFRGEAHRQTKVFREEIFPQARRLFQNEVAKRNVLAGEAKQQKPADGPEISPLPSSTKKRKKGEKEEYLPSMPCLASMLLADPFVIRVIIARILRELRRGVMNGTSIPAAHSVVPSLLQLLHMARWSKEICAVRGKRYFIPDCGIQGGNPSDPGSYVPYITLRRHMPLLLRLFLETDLNTRVANGGDLHAASQASSFQPLSVTEDDWERSDQLEVTLSLTEGALVFVCQPGTGNDNALAITFPKFAVALKRLSKSLCDDRPFFVCLIQTILRHKAKLSKTTRDAIFESWLDWLKEDSEKDGSLASCGHEYLVRLLVEWSSFGNLLLPRDTLIKYSLEIVKHVGSSTKKFSDAWKSNDASFQPTKDQYERLLKLLPSSQADQWKKDTGVTGAPAEDIADTAETTDLK